MIHLRPSGGLLNGVITHFINKEETNKFDFTYTKDWNSKTHPENVIDRKTNTYVSMYPTSDGMFVQIELKEYWLDISDYVIYYAGTYYPMNYNFSISLDGVDWFVLDEKVNSTYYKEIRLRSIRTKRCIARFFRWTSTGVQGTGYDGFYITEIELFGDLYACNGKCKYAPHIINTCRNKQTKISSLNLFIIIFLEAFT